MKKCYLVYTIVTTWDEPPRARHQLTYELMKEGVVYFVEKNRVGRPRLEIRQVEENLFVITPYFWLPYKIRYRTPGINEHYHNWLLKEIQSLKLSFEFVTTFDYTAPVIHDYFNNVVFYCADDNVGFGKFNPWFVNKYHSTTEQQVAQKAKMCIVTSDYMGKKIGQYNNYTYVVPLGAPSVVPAKSKIAATKSSLPVLGLVGYLDSNLHYPLIESMLQRFRIIFIGPANKGNKKRLSTFQNAVLLGVKTGKALQEALEQVDVCIAPYDVQKLNKGATPNKMWLYLSLGKPVVLTDMPNINSWVFEDKLVYKCDNKDFIDNCIQAFKDDCPVLVSKRIQLAKDNSWENRVKRIKELYYGIKD